jgi:hypothetical protein
MVGIDTATFTSILGVGTIGGQAPPSPPSMKIGATTVGQNESSTTVTGHDDGTSESTDSAGLEVAWPFSPPSPVAAVSELLGTGTLGTGTLGIAMLGTGILGTGLDGTGFDGAGVVGVGVIGVGVVGAGCGPVPGVAGSGVAGSVSAISPGAFSPHSQYHDQFQIQSRPLPSPASVEISVVSSHHVNVQTQTQGGSPPAGALAGAVPDEVLAAVLGGAVLVCVTGPPSPGLSTLIETFTFAGPFAGPACGPPDPRSSVLVFELASCSVGTVAPAFECDGSHDQFQIQFHSQSRDVESPLSAIVDAVVPSQTDSSQFQIHGAISPPVDESDSVCPSD